MNKVPPKGAPAGGATSAKPVDVGSDAPTSPELGAPVETSKGWTPYAKEAAEAPTEPPTSPPAPQGTSPAEDPMRANLERLERASAAAALTQVGKAPYEKPPDAMKLLRDAQPAGVLFREEPNEQRADEQGDPELAAAVEEAIRLLFGVPGILRISPGRNEQGEPVVLVVADRGFTQASMDRVPPKVHRFATLVALPYDLLPLKRT